MKNWLKKGRTVVDGDSGIVVAETPQRSVSRLGTHGYAEALLEDEQNTNILAAAPDLLLALQNMVARFDLMTNYLPVEQANDATETSKAAHAAITKAKGGAA